MPVPSQRSNWKLVTPQVIKVAFMDATLKHIYPLIFGTRFFLHRNMLYIGRVDL